MGISTRQYQDIMNEYDAVRRRNYMAEQERKERIYACLLYTSPSPRDCS